MQKETDGEAPNRQGLNSFKNAKMYRTMKQNNSFKGSAVGMTSPRETAFTLNSTQSKKNETAKKVPKKPDQKFKGSRTNQKPGRLPQPMQVPLTPQAAGQKPNNM